MIHRLLHRGHRAGLAPEGPHGTARGLARGLGWFSIALGLAELMAPRALSRGVGLGGQARLAQICGLREIAAGIGLLAARDPAPWVKGRIAGDVLDLAGLLPAMRADNPARGQAGLALGAVAAVTLLDICCARQLARHHHGAEVTRRLRSAARA